MTKDEFCRIADENGLKPRAMETLICRSPTQWNRYRNGKQPVSAPVELFMGFVDRHGPVSAEIEARSEQLYYRDEYNAARALLPDEAVALIPFERSFKAHAIYAVLIALIEKHGI